MAKRELSSTLKSLKFMQRGIQKEEPPKKEVEEVKVDGNFASPNTQKKKCIVIMEGNPHPGALKGRMSFQSFNPNIDKLNDEAANPGQSQVPTTSSDVKTSDRENGSSPVEPEITNAPRPGSDYDRDHERKHPGTVAETQYPNKSPKSLSGEGGQQSSERNSRGSHKKQKRGRLDWNLLRPPKAQKRQG